MNIFFARWKWGFHANRLLVIAIFTVLANLLLVVNPGFYNHDEWQRYDFLMAHGLRAFIEKFGVLREGLSFRTPVRPLGFIQQGLTAYWMKTTPQFAHLFDVILHAVVAIIFFKVLVIAHMRRNTALLASLIFSVSPLTALATGWSAASFDQWYALFALLAVGTTIAIMQTGLSGWKLLIVGLCSSAAILSKETALMLPLAMAGGATGYRIHGGEKILWRRMLPVCCIAAVPIAIYMAVRFPALLRSMQQHSDGAYALGLRNVLPNILGYLEFPFIPRLGEMVSIVFVAQPARHAALLVHAVLILMIAIGANWKAAVAYVFAYGVFLLPVIAIANTGSHYLYASGFGLSAALAWLITVPRKKPLGKIVALFGVACLCITLLHSYYLQTEIYNDGVCQRTFLTGLDAAMTSRQGSGAKTGVIEWNAGTPIYLGSRAIFGRDQYKSISFEKEPHAGALNPGAIHMDAGCEIR